MGNVGGSSPGLCISRRSCTEHWHLQAGTGGHNSGKRRTVYRRWQAGQRAGAPGREDPGRRSPHAAVVTHGSRFCVQSWIPTFHGNFTPVEFVASNFFLDSQFRVFLTIFLKSLSSWLLRLLLALSVYDSSWFSSEGHWQGSRYCPRLLTWQQKEPRITKKSEDWWAQELV